MLFRSAGHSETRVMQAWRIDQLRPWFIGVGVLSATGGLTVLALVAKTRFHSARMIVAATGFACVMALVTGAFTSIATLYSVKPLLSRVGTLDPKGTIYTVRDFDWTLPFYVGHPVVPVAYVGELELGLRTDPARGLTTVEDFKRLWAAQTDPGDEPLYALIREIGRAHV